MSASLLLAALLACSGPAPVSAVPAADVPSDTGADDPPDSPADSVPDDIETLGDAPLGDPTLVCAATLTCPSGVVDDWKLPCDLTIVSGDGAPVYDAMAMVELRGRSSAAFPKPPYGLELHTRAELLVAPTARWRFEDGATAPAGWESATYDDSGWRTGAAPLGYGDAPTTTVSYGANEANKRPSVRFRTSFELADPASVAELDLGLLRDDGAIVWLNGVEVVRSNLAPTAGPLDFALTTIADDYEALWSSWDIDPAVLVAGTNTLAVEVHQSSADSSDLRFDLSLLASAGRPEPDLFGMGGEDDWILQSAYVDRLLWRNKLAYDVFQSFGGAERWGAEQVFCELTLDGDYRGVYLLGEPVRRGAGRIDLPEDETGASFIVKLDDVAGFRASTVSYGVWQAVYPRQTEANTAAIVAIDATLAAWEAAVTARDESQWELMDLDSAVDWVILEELFKNNDAYFLSVHLWRAPGGKLHFAPWDFDLTLGYPYYDCGPTGFVGRAAFVDAFAASASFRQRFAARWRELRAGPLADAELLGRVAGYEATMGGALARNFERWPVADIAFGWGDVANWLCPAASWEEEHSRVLAWIPERTAWLDTHVSGF